MTRSESHGDENGAQEGDSEKDAVGVDGEGTDMKNFWVHEILSVVRVVCHQ